MIKCINFADLKIVDLSEKDNFIKPKDMNVGFSTTAAIADLRKENVVTKKQIAAFFWCYHFPRFLNRKKYLRRIRFPVQLFVILQYLTRKKLFLLILSCNKVR